MMTIRVSHSFLVTRMKTTPFFLLLLLQLGCVSCTPVLRGAYRHMAVLPDRFCANFRAKTVRTVFWKACEDETHRTVEIFYQQNRFALRMKCNENHEKFRIAELTNSHCRDVFSWMSLQKLVEYLPDLRKYFM